MDDTTLKGIVIIVMYSLFGLVSFFIMKHSEDVEARERRQSHQS